MRHALIRHDLGEGVVYAVVTRHDFTLVIINPPELLRRARGLLGRLRLPAVRQRQPTR